ncbi:Glutaredoxin-1 [Babesia sp. Xinjiang]|uniref:Glutaredoxin-1 n=1 Tax=Babesia sp. Xinjiang TaxID=462227 RepID=UPI000A22B6D4|nr:Glutaredoxin-1 [Babesia sp. Xinjiang]ORM39826.1 Glutaredoxin-1 [Babesia sp. Xinjiang]
METAEISAWINDHLAKSKVVVFSRSTCPYCVKASGILMGEAPSDVTIVDLDDNPNRPAIMEYFRETTGAATVPRVFIGGKFYGDCSKTVSTLQSGELRKALQNAGCHLK